MIKVDRHTCGQHAFFSLHNGENEDDFRNMLKSYRIKEIIAERDAVPKRRSNKNLNKITKLNKEIGKLTKGIADIIYAECEIIDESSVGCAAMVIENLIRKEQFL